ncbi:MAG TPA: transporter substrate-binding domain-containing protein [Burkholderiales bacterium]|nr:transporter substrate-binding domain-containing protein [Burkholderiales bacterium]
MTADAPPAARSELAPGGKLRVGLNYGNFLLVLKDAPDGAPRGIAPDLGRELGARLGVPVEFVKFQQAGQLADGVRDGKCDVGFLGAEPQRAAEIAFTGAYLEIPVTFLVPAGSAIRSIAEVDREGVRVAVSARSAYDLFLSRTLKHAKLVRTEGIDASYQLFNQQKLEVLAGLKPRLVSDAEKLPGARVLEGQVTGVQQALGVPRNRESAARFTREFVDEAKRSGLVARIIERHGVKGVTVAP